MKGRKLGSIELSIDEIQTIVDMTKKGKTRPEIAKAIGRGKSTVYRYQKRLIL